MVGTRKSAGNGQKTPGQVSGSSDPVDRSSCELVIALVGPVGSGVSASAEILAHHLRSHFGYQVPPVIKLSDIIRSEGRRYFDHAVDQGFFEGYIAAMQQISTALHDRFGPAYLAEKAIERITEQREALGGYQELDGRRVPRPLRTAYIIDSIKNVDEYRLLRQVYGDMLVLFGVFAPDERRRDRLLSKGASPQGLAGLLRRDEGEAPTFGKSMRDAFNEADFFICNDTGEAVLRGKIERFLNILFGSEIHTPTSAEAAMFAAEAAAVNSACLSRQVGAALISAKGELIGVGWNDVPRPGGGLYREDDAVQRDKVGGQMADRDKRCFRLGDGRCHNETRRRFIIDDILKRSIDGGLLREDADEGRLRGILQQSGVNAVIEYSRSIHAEMEAILSVARDGKQSLVGATLFATTFPCHNCARHIVAAGIREVVYIQPYRKSLALELHGDAITETPDKDDKVLFRQYDGVAPRNFQRLFKQRGERKANALYQRPDPRTALPVLSVALDSFSDHESRIIARLTGKEGRSA